MPAETRGFRIGTCLATAPRVARWLLVLALLPGCYRHHLRDVDAPPDAGRDAGVPTDVPLGPPVTVACAEVLAPPSAATVVPCALPGSGDADGDGFADPVDCNDCVPQINPAAFDIPGDGVDGDCDGLDASAPSDEPRDGADAFDAACAIGLCHRATTGWGLVSARWTNAGGTGMPSAMSHRVTDTFGTYRPVDGAQMLVLSTGDARPGVGGCVESDVFDDSEPPGFPVASPACPGTVSGPVYDSVALELDLRVPSNALGIRFTSNFMTREYPDFLCSSFNDVYAVFLDEGSGLANIVFDRAGNPVTVNNALLRTCVERGPLVCELGAAPLAGAFGHGEDMCGFDESVLGGGTDCISTTTAVRGGSTIRLRFALWDSGDGVFDSNVLIDSFGFVLDDFEVVVTP